MELICLRSIYDNGNLDRKETSIEFQEMCINTIRFLAVEAESILGWGRYIGIHGDMIGIDRFGA
jgi:transketolase